MKGILGRKLGMTQVFTTDGVLIPVTVVEALPNVHLEVGNEVKVDLFAAGEIVDVTGTSKGRGYNGTIVRNNATMGPKTHGGSKNMRHIGSLATTGRNNGRIEKGTAGAGQEGGYTTTTQNL